MAYNGISDGNWTPVKLTMIDSSNDQITYLTQDGVMIRVKSEQKFTIHRNENGQYHFDGINDAIIFGSYNNDNFIFTNSKNNTINMANDGHGGDIVRFDIGTKGNTVIGDKCDMTKDINARNNDLHLYKSIFIYKQD